MKKFVTFLLILLLDSYDVAYCQYTGGNGRGDIALTHLDTNTIVLQLFHGGNGRGDIALTHLDTNTIALQLFHGGNGRGDFALALLDTNTIVLQLFHGGNGRGDFALALLDTNTIFLPLFHGGNGRGDFALVLLDTNTIVLPLFHGGNGRGDFALALLDTNTIVLPLFHGGNGRGDFALALLDTNTIVLPLFHGGNGRGDIALTQLNIPIPVCLLPDFPSVIATADTVCNGEDVKLKVVSGSLHSATQWQWYSGSCGGISVDSGETIEVSPTATTIYFVRGEGGCVVPGNCANFTITLIPCNITLNLKLFIEGYYLGAGLMQAAVDPVNFPVLCDTIIAELHNVNSPYANVYSSKNTISTSGNGSFIFPQSSAGNYYLVVRHRNAIETWSSAPINVINNLFYDFTNAQNKAYGNNLVSLGDGNFAIWSGDISDASLGVGHQDGVIESQDYSDMENAVGVILQGYVPEDITGDGVVESSDYSLMENNVSNIVFSIHP